VLAHSATSERLIKFFAPRVALMKEGSNYLLVALKKSPSVTAGTLSTNNSSQLSMASNDTTKAEAKE
jgi:hypothetical protein